MNIKTKISLEILFVLDMLFLLVVFILWFYLTGSSNVTEYFGLFLENKVYIFYFIAIFVVLNLLVFYILQILLKKNLSYLEEYNNKLKDYNKYLAHELKTPISILNSNLDIINYEHSSQKIIESKEVLKNMNNIIVGLLNFSQSIQLSNKSDINLENFIKKNIYFYQQDKENTIIIKNSEFNLFINTDEVLFSRVIKNIVENALKYSPDKKLEILIKKEKIIFINDLYKTLDELDLEKMFNKDYSATYNKNKWAWLWCCLLKEILNVLWYELKINSKENKFYLEIIFN